MLIDTQDWNTDHIDNREKKTTNTLFMPNLSCKVYRQNKMEKGQGHGFNTGLCLILAAQHRKDPTNWLKVTTNIVGLEPLAWRERFQHQGWFSWARRHPAAFLTLGGV